MRFSTSRKNGFTLIELLVVIAIIGVLAALLTASLSDSRAKGRDGQRTSDIRQIQNALQLYFSVNGGYPQNLYVASGTPPLVAAGFLPTIPVDPAGGTPYSYATIACVSSVCRNYHVGASFERENIGLEADADFISPSGFSGSDVSPCSTGDRGSSCYDIYR